MVNLMIWHEADITTQLVCIGVSVCRPLYKDWLNDVVVKIGSTTGGGGSHAKSRSEGASSGGFSVIALQTIGGSSVHAKGGGGGGRKDSSWKDVDGDAVKVERSWRVESKSRSAVFPGDAASDEHILGDAGVADVDQGDRRQG